MRPTCISPVKVDEYLAIESTNARPHEYVAGLLFQREDSTREHNLITGNIVAILHARLRGGPCQVFTSAFKVRLEVAREDIFYYPDVMVSCDRNDKERYYSRTPTLVFEVLSPSTETIDRREKHMNYRHAPTLEEYVLVAQESRNYHFSARHGLAGRDFHGGGSRH
jgi:Uma2 family endonuclease